MSSLAPDRAALLPLLPEGKVGTVTSIEPLTQGLSGAGVYAVTASRGEARDPLSWGLALLAAGCASGARSAEST